MREGEISLALNEASGRKMVQGSQCLIRSTLNTNIKRKDSQISKSWKRTFLAYCKCGVNVHRTLELSLTDKKANENNMFMEQKNKK